MAILDIRSRTTWEMEFIKKFEYGFNKIKHRGPDESNLYIKDGYILGFHRLSILDTSEQGMQPFYYKDENTKEEIILMCNGEIYNYKELIKEYNLTLSNNSTSDCAILIDLYRKVGFEKMWTLLNGDFAIILIHETGEQLDVYLARDRIGVRPLFYGKTNEGYFAISSEAKSLEDLTISTHQFIGNTCHINNECELNYTNLDKITYTPSTLNLINSNIYSAINYCLTESVKTRLGSDRDIGVLLSGGLDSSLITSILCKYIGSNNVRTYSIGIDKNSPDLKNAKIVSNYLGTNHTEVIIPVNKMLESIQEVIQKIESYDVTTIRASVPMYLLGKYISENTNDKVIFSGEGSDELFGGYLYFHNAPNLEELNKESERLVNNLRYYDVLRADRCMSTNGLELRVPFLDPDFIYMCSKLDPKYKSPVNGIEKYYLRMAFKDGYLPESVLFRRKDGFSDGVSSHDKSWYEYIQEYIDKYDMIENGTEMLTLKTKESKFYKNIYDEHYKKYSPIIPTWMPKWSDSDDPSSRRITFTSK